MNREKVIFIKERTKKSDVRNSVSEEIYEELLQNGFVVRDIFLFVGVFYSETNKVIIIGYPKYLPYNAINKEEKEKISIHMEFVCQVIEKLRTRINNAAVLKDIFNPNSSNVNTVNVDKYSLAEYILKDYLKYGLYTKNYIKNGSRDKGTINWSKTIDLKFPIIDKNIVYNDTINRYKEVENSNLITAIHSCIVNQCIKIMNIFGKYKNIELPELGLNLETDLSVYIKVLTRNIVYVYNSREIELFKALIAWCSLTKFYEQNMIGVTAFDKIWEFVNFYVFGNIENTGMGNPNYVIDKKQYVGLGEEIPDILRVFEYSNAGYICILDAKYYTIKLDNDKIYAAPANSDIAKQIQYYNHLKEIYVKNKLSELKFSNSFLIPIFEENNKCLYKYLGYVSQNNTTNNEIISNIKNIININTNIKKTYVTIYSIEPLELYKYYLQGTKVNDMNIVKDFVNKFNDMNEVNIQREDENGIMYYI